MTDPVVNFNDPTTIPEKYRWTQSIEPEEDPKDAQLRRWKEGSLFFVAMVAIIVLMGACAYVAFGFGAATASADDRKWAMSVLTLGVGGLLGYLVRK